MKKSSILEVLKLTKDQEMWNSVVICGKVRPRPAGTHSSALCVAPSSPPPHPRLSTRPFPPAAPLPSLQPRRTRTNHRCPNCLVFLRKAAAWRGLSLSAAIFTLFFSSPSFSPLCLSPGAAATAEFRFPLGEESRCFSRLLFIAF